jgi:ABC-type transport system involved in multi-copper enzyme maturation permease subunit
MFGGGVWPVVQRELRAAARRPLGPWLRVGGALGGIAAFWISTDIPYDQMGVALFDRVHTLLLWLICAMIPALSADCLARERREGTLGLLFLTPLTASGIVLGKFLAQMLRAWIVWLSVLPVLTIPFLIGGVSRADVIGLLLIELSVGFLCLAAGVLASSLTANRALAFTLAFLLMAVFVAESGPIGSPVLRSMAYSLFAPTASEPIVQLFPPGLPIVFSAQGIPPPVPDVLNILAEDFIIAALILLAALRFAGWRVKRSWQDQIRSARHNSWLKRYCTPVLKRWFVRSMRRALERNPIAWLQQYSWKARATKWGLCLLAVVAESAVLGGNAYFNGESHVMIILLLILAAAFLLAGVNGFFHEKKSGALELILVSPLSVNQIIFGRVWGLWRQFFPAVFLLLASDFLLRATIPDHSLFFYYSRFGGDMDWDNTWMLDLEIVTVFLTVPVVATCFALIFKNLFVVSALTAALVFGPATVLFFHEYLKEALFSSALIGSFRFGLGTLLDILPPAALWVMVAHACSVIFAYRRLRRNLTRRNYSF